MKSKKSIKLAYKEMKFQMGVFVIRNLVNDKIFIDQSLDVDSNWNRHKFELKFGSHRNRELQKDWNQYGENKFKFEILSELKESKEENINYIKALDTLQKTIVQNLTEQNVKFY